MIRFVENPTGDHDERYAVHKSGEDFGAMIPVSPGRGRRTCGEIDCQPTNEKRGSIRKHMHRITEQRKATRPNTADEFAEENAKCDKHSKLEFSL